MPLKEKTWSKEMEEPIRKKWRETKRYAFNENTKKPVFSIDTPPPYINAPVHIGHATVYTLMDMFARFKRMTGHEVIFPLGLDRNGLPIEVAAEKKFNVIPTVVGREKFIEYCEKLLEEFSMASVDTFYKLGHSFCSWELGNHLADGSKLSSKARNNIGDVYYTDSPEYRALTQATFIDIWKKGLVYEDK
ncbi:MAG: class I tRNA ligase family protein, partial [Nanoarchaeota archaeon]|nr:class I tRNA ligase family protein [Nanoarchaeota archaeon]